ncbi:acetyl-CoA carboxylase biotin carboxyl carrier protein [Rhodococcus sp. NPDC057529]|uniref:acetyl-CoA carboxylase biotin carboxyl carrier protein n=1 Tax=Rhodococcus sp. NPDC057529 TaxID=3346158 RepID=UPI0036724D62
MDFDLEELAAIIEQLDKTEFTEFRFEQGDVRIAVRRGSAGPELDRIPLSTPATAPASAAAPATVPSDVAVDRTPVPADPPTTAADPGDIVVTAPMLGTFYRSPKPGEPTFVEVGDKVEADEVVCIVEVMKLMNSVPAGAQGEITAVFAADGDLVEFGQPLFAIRPIG